MTPPQSTLKAELSRKVIHLVSAIIPLAYAFWPVSSALLVILLLLLAMLITIELSRRFWRDGAVACFFNRHCGYMLRDNEKSHRLLGSTNYCLSCIICIGLFARPVAVLALLYLAVGDTVASLAGRAWGKTKIVGNKSLEGSAAFWASCSLVALAAWDCSPRYSLIIGLIGAPAAMLAELYVPYFDDNFSIPIISGVVMSAVLALL